MFTMGKVRFWFLPNLTAECGFFESFVPLYTYANNKVDDKSKKKSKKDKFKNAENPKKEKPTEDQKVILSVNNEKKEENKIEDRIEDRIDSNDSEESSESTKDEDWVKVKKHDMKQDEVNC